MVRKRILISSSGDQLSIYCMSIFIQVLKSSRSRPASAHRQVSPGRSLASRHVRDEPAGGLFDCGERPHAGGLVWRDSLSVTSCRRELAICAALGAEQRHIRRLDLGEGFRLIADGVIAGLAMALILSRVLKTFLFAVTLILHGVGAAFAGSPCSPAGRRPGARVK